MDKNRANFSGNPQNIYIFPKDWKLRECWLTNATPKCTNNLEHGRGVLHRYRFSSRSILEPRGVRCLPKAYYARLPWTFPRHVASAFGERVLARYSTSSALTVMIPCRVNCYTQSQMNICANEINREPLPRWQLRVSYLANREYRRVSKWVSNIYDQICRVSSFFSFPLIFKFTSKNVEWCGIFA